jgi:hypothetical protein
MDPVYILPPYFFKNYFNIRPSIPCSSKWAFLFCFFDPKTYAYLVCSLRATYDVYLKKERRKAGGIVQTAADGFVSGGSAAEQPASSRNASH